MKRFRDLKIGDSIYFIDQEKKLVKKKISFIELEDDDCHRGQRFIFDSDSNWNDFVFLNNDDLDESILDNFIIADKNILHMKDEK